MKTVRTYGNSAEAGFAQSVLAAGGIDAVIADEYAGTLGLQFVPGGMRLQVPEEDAERALEILDAEAGVEGDSPDVTTGENVAVEHEVDPRGGAESGSPNIICPGCGAEWALTEEEAKQPSFTCPDCRVLIPLREVMRPPARSRRFDWSCFLPRSESKWVFVVVFAAYNKALEGLWWGITYPFVPYRDTSSYYTAHGWPYVMGRLADAIVVYPIAETLLLVAIIELLRAPRAPTIVQVFFATLAPCAVDGYRWWPHGLNVAPGFVLMAYAYLYWRPISWRNGIVIVIAIHALYNGTLYVRMVLDQVHKDFVVTELRGKIANDRYSTSNEYLSLGIAYRDAGHPREGESAIREALALTGTENQWGALYDLSFVLYDEKRLQEALDSARQALPIAPADKRYEVEGQIQFLAPKVNGTSR